MASGEVTFLWGDGEHTFHVAIGQVRELQEKTNSGPLEVFKRLHNGAWRIDDYRETIRLGLIGGGMEPAKAMRLVMTYVDERPAVESILAAQAILMPFIFGTSDEKVPDSGEENGRRMTTDSPSSTSTESVQ